jgi:hypothetical protein
MKLINHILLDEMGNGTIMIKVATKNFFFKKKSTWKSLALINMSHRQF